mmetsp:Transcript_24754/g.35660  ORF Transcript_24754/g.35660 Transcript_24754/m.35660 type:complete len:152 (-) Transcript_24754:715-1170(-)
MTSFVALRTGLLIRRRFATSACRYFTTASTRMQMSEINEESKCVPCEGIGAALSSEEATEKMKLIKGWSISDDSKSITKKLKLKNFASALDYINRIGQVAEGQGHHPDLHITGYQYVQIDLMTHALAGLTDNDFIMAVCIDALPVELSKKP